MNASSLTFFKNFLVKLHDAVRDYIREAMEQLLSSPELSDIRDRATWEEQCTSLLRIVDEEKKLLPKFIWHLSECGKENMDTAKKLGNL